MDELAEEMKLFYELESKATSIVEGNHYAVFDGSWHRVKCIRCNDSTATVFFVDRGDKDNFPVEKLYILDEKFCLLPAQAVKMSLSGLEIFSDCRNVDEILNEVLFDQLVFAEINLNKNDNDCLSVDLYQEIDEKTIHINELITDRLLRTILHPNSYIEKVSHKN